MKKPEIFLKMLKYCRRQKTDNETARERRRDYWFNLLTEAGYQLPMPGEKVMGCGWMGITLAEGWDLVVSGFEMSEIERLLDTYGVKYPKRRGRNRKRPGGDK